MKFKVLFILTGVIILHAVILSGICLTGGCKSPAVLGPRSYIKAPPPAEEITDEQPIPDIKGAGPKITVSTTPVAMSSPPVFELGTPPQDIYVVKRGDSFWKIAKAHGVTMQNLAAYNDMALNKVLKVGDKLKIPPGGYAVKGTAPAVKTAKKSSPAKTKALSRPSDGTYVVKRGDSFWKIARRYNLRTKTLLDANNMTGKETLRVGQKLIIPDGKKAVSAAAPSTVAKAEPAKTANETAKSILDTVDSPEVKSAAPTQKSTAVKKLVEDIDASSDASERAVQVIKDIKVANFAKQYNVTPELLKKLNDDYPADGVFKAGSVVIVRSVE